LMMAQPLHCSFAWLENVICPNYWGTPVHSLWICELWVFIQNNRATNYHCMILGGCWVTKISSEKGQGRQTGCLRLKLVIFGTEANKERKDQNKTSFSLQGNLLLYKNVSQQFASFFPVCKNKRAWMMIFMRLRKWKVSFCTVSMNENPLMSSSNANQRNNNK
jgi:hypothetical protein